MDPIELTSYLSMGLATLVSVAFARDGRYRTALLVLCILILFDILYIRPVSTVPAWASDGLLILLILITLGVVIDTILNLET
ncbi:hypothetical protein [Halomicrobium salinisoli]|uniref:hypothetical protein n=1 Tax=Halomicrobium salinisoli TaxID=2878391 RepID=UPI001CEFC3B1|nr:hypothetical protein [Halomicrobium salinisoli]